MVLVAQAPPVVLDTPASRQAAIARLRSAAPREVCADGSRMSRPYGTTCASREFPAPPILSEPKMVWNVKPGWWGAWSPLVAGDRVLSGSCNNDDNNGLSAFDTKTGKLVWRISGPCDAGNRRGSTGSVALHELPSGEVLWIYARENNEPADYYVVDVKAGRIVRSLKPVKRGPTRENGGLFTVLTQSEKAQTSYINGLNSEMDQLIWRNDGFRSACKDELNPRCKPVFSAVAVSDGILFQTATTRNQPDPPTRQLHAIDVRTGKTLWIHTSQPVTEQNGSGTAYRSDDGLPMVAGGKVIIKVEGLLGAVPAGNRANGAGLRAFDPRTGAVLWTTAPVETRQGRFINNRVAAGNILVTEVQTNQAKELYGYRLTDGSLAWRRPAPVQARLLASSGGVFYLSERVGKEDFRLQGLDGESGVLLWSTIVPGHDLPFDQSWGIEDSRKTGLQGPSWRIGRDGAIYGVTLVGVYKLQ
jgi:outer membrane protein assembly factor BamB